ncbi:uncharacterized protein [Amphiura filiformis]|uniref:uncharacterized protein n=1 Tax=Amphiura filiformis TaxID=82378 RepID=UPI003B21079D
MKKGDLQFMKKASAEDLKNYGIPLADMGSVKTSDDFFSCLEKKNMMSEDNLYFLQFLLHQCGNRSAFNLVDEYAKGRSKLKLKPLILERIKRRKSGKGRKKVEFRIKGDFKHANRADASKFKKLVSESLGIPRRHINLVGIGRGSIILVFQIPDIGIERLRQAVNKKRSWLYENSVLDVHIEGEGCMWIQDDSMVTGNVKTCDPTHKDSDVKEEDSIRYNQLKRSASSTMEDVYPKCQRKRPVIDGLQTPQEPNITYLQHWQQQHENQQQHKQDFHAADTCPKVAPSSKKCEAEVIHVEQQTNMDTSKNTNPHQQTCMDTIKTNKFQKPSMDISKNTDSQHQPSTNTNMDADAQQSSHFLEMDPGRIDGKGEKHLSTQEDNILVEEGNETSKGHCTDTFSSSHQQTSMDTNKSTDVHQQTCRETNKCKVSHQQINMDTSKSTDIHQQTCRETNKTDSHQQTCMDTNKSTYCHQQTNMDTSKNTYSHHQPSTNTNMDAEAQQSSHFLEMDPGYIDGKGEKHQKKSIQEDNILVEEGANETSEVHSTEMFSKDSNEFRFIVTGETGSGKSATANSILHQCGLFKSSMSASAITKTCMIEKAEMKDRVISIVDTPGLFDADMNQHSLVQEMTKCFMMTVPGPHAIILVTRIGQMSQKVQETVRLFRELFGEKCMECLVVVFTGGDSLSEVGTTIEEYLGTIEGDVADILRDCNNRYVVFDNTVGPDSQENNDQVDQLLAIIDDMVRTNGGRHYTNDMLEEAGGKVDERECELHQEFKEIQADHVQTTSNQKGTWMAPEIFQGEVFSKPTDTFSCGMMVYECQTGIECQTDSFKIKALEDSGRRDLKEELLEKAADGVRQDLNTDTLTENLAKLDLSGSNTRGDRLQQRTDSFTDGCPQNADDVKMSSTLKQEDVSVIYLLAANWQKCSSSEDHVKEGIDVCTDGNVENMQNFFEDPESPSEFVKEGLDLCLPQLTTTILNSSENQDSNVFISEMQDRTKEHTHPCHPAGIILQRSGYYTIPSLEELAKMTDDDGICEVKGLTIGREGYGSVFYPGETKLTGMNLDEIVHFNDKEISIYPDESVKPPVGQWLNKEAVVTLHNIWPSDKTTKQPITDLEVLKDMEYSERLEKATERQGAAFVDYKPETGSCIFKVEHFSKYGLAVEVKNLTAKELHMKKISH